MIAEHEIPIPRWDITDPFGRAAIRRARWEYKRKAAECESLHYELESLYADRDGALSKLVDYNKTLQEKLDATEKLLRRSDEGRTALAKDNWGLKAYICELQEKINELEETHERVIRAMTDKEEIE